MRLEDLQVFAVLARSDSVHRAAQICGMTQSAVTKVLQRLESEFGIRLADRSGRGFKLTPAGKILQDNANILRNSVADLQVQMQAARSELAGELRIGVVPPVLDAILLPLVARSAAENPTLSFKLSVQVTSLLIDAVIDGKLDLALVYLTDDAPADLSTDLLGIQQYKVVGRNNHPLFQQADLTAQLNAARWLLPQPPNAARDLIVNYYRGRHLPDPRITIECSTSASTLATLIPQSNLLTLLTPQLLSGQLGQQLSVLTFPGLHLSNNLRIIFRRNSTLSPATQRFRTMLLNSTAQLRSVLGPEV